MNRLLVTRLLRALEVALYLALVIDMAVLVGGIAHDPQWEPDGGVSLIVIALLIGVVYRLRHGHWPGD